jgi:hypothetical protein
MNLKDKGWKGVNWINIARNNDRKRATVNTVINHLNAKLNPICYLLTLLGAHHFLHVSRIRVNVHAENLCD